MAFAYTVAGKFAISRAKVLTWGTFTNGESDSGGAIVTGLKKADVFFSNYNNALGNETMKVSKSGGTVTIVTSDNADGDWLAIGL
jgi:hypothetical protein